MEKLLGRVLTDVLDRRFVGEESMVDSAHPARMVVGVSGSLSNLAALHDAVELARPANIAVLAGHAWLPAGRAIAYRRGPRPPLLQIWSQQAQQTLTEAFTDAFGGPPSGVALSCQTRRGQTGPVLVAATQNSHHLLVIGSGRRRYLSRIRPRKISCYCLAHAECPLLAVAAPEMLLDARRRHRHRHRHRHRRASRIQRAVPDCRSFSLVADRPPSPTVRS